MATVNLKHHFWSGEIDEKKEYPIVFVIRHNGTHSHINTGIKLEKRFWDKDKGIKKGAPKIIDHLRANSDLSQKMADIQLFISELTSTGEIHYMNAAAIKQRYEERRAKEKYNFNTYYIYCIEQKKGKTKEVYQYTYDLITKFRSVQLNFSDVNIIVDNLIRYLFAY